VLDTPHAKRYARTLAELQDALGLENDCATGARLLARLEPPRRLATFARKWFAQRVRDNASHLDKLAARLAASL
jgi:hypothetical protein